MIQYEEYHPYGSTAWWAGDSALVSQKRYRYTGMERDEETGLQCHGVRYYAPWLGRWTSADPIGLGDGVNRYAYVHCSPASGNDKTGLAETGSRAEAQPSSSFIRPNTFTLRGLLAVKGYIDNELAELPVEHYAFGGGATLELSLRHVSAIGISVKPQSAALGAQAQALLHSGEASDRVSVNARSFGSATTALTLGPVAARIDGTLTSLGENRFRLKGTFKIDEPFDFGLTQGAGTNGASRTVEAQLATAVGAVVLVGGEPYQISSEAVPIELEFEYVGGSSFATIESVRSIPGVTLASGQNIAGAADAFTDEVAGGGAAAVGAASTVGAYAAAGAGNAALGTLDMVGAAGALVGGYTGGWALEAYQEAMEWYRDEN